MTLSNPFNHFDAPLVFFLWILYLLYRRFTRISLSDIPGPKSPSFWVGNSEELYNTECGTTEAGYQEEFGAIVSLKASLGEDQLWVADPRALQHILQSSGYRYIKSSGDRAILELVADRGVASVEGDVHKRHKRVMQPAFSEPQARASLPVFLHIANKIVDRWTNLITSDPSGTSTLIDLPSWTSKASLDAIGFTAFGYDFGAIDDADNPLTKSYTNLLTAALGAPSMGKHFVMNTARHVPESILRFIYEHLPRSDIAKLRQNRIEVHQVAKQLLDSKRQELTRSEGHQDIMSLLLKANLSEKENARLQDDEIIPQMRTIMLAGSETTSLSETWALYELAKNQQVQHRLRAEIRETMAKVRARGATDLTIADVETMSYTTAVVKETLRLHSAVPEIMREAGADDVIPLSKPITTRSGKVIDGVPVPKGLTMHLSLHAYNTDKGVWGDDAHEFNPDRWLVAQEKKETMLGMYGNLMTFSTGHRHCLGWRLAVCGIQAFLITLIDKFHFSFPENAKRIREDRAGTRVCTVEGEEHKGVQLPMKISLLSDDSD